MTGKWSIRLIAVAAAALLAAGCSEAPGGDVNVEAEPPESIRDVADRLRGSVQDVSLSVNNQGICGPGDVLFVEVHQSPAAGADGFNDTTTHNVIRLLTAIKDGGHDFALDYKALTSGVDRYGNSATDDIHWLCYTARDAEKINTDNRDFLEMNVLTMNSFGQNDVERFFRGQP